MQKTISLLPFLIITLLGISINSCVKDDTTDFGYGIDPESQKNLLCKSLRVNGQNKDGSMPVGVGSGSPIVISYPQAVEISAGVLLFIPYRVNDTSRVCQVYLQVEGADNYWETKLTLDPTSRQPYFKILIPRFVRDGDFNLVFSVGDCKGNVSRLYSTKTIVSPLADCNTSISGTVGITVRAFDLGDKQGRAGFAYEMYSIPDRLDIRYAGKWVASTGKLFDDKIVIPDCGNKSEGFVSGKGGLTFDYDPKLSRFVEVYISGCNTGTEWNVKPACPKEEPLLGIHTSVSSNWSLINIWNHGHAWITITENNKTTTYGLWPDTNKEIIDAKRTVGNDMQTDFEKVTGIYSRFMYITPDKLKEVQGFMNKNWEYDLLTRNCSTFAQKTWKVGTSEELAASEFITGGVTESPRKLGYSIERSEVSKPTAYLRPTDVPITKSTSLLDSFK
jgi:hypothetical protein